MVDLVNPTRCKKISGKIDKPKHRQRIQIIPILMKSFWNKNEISKLEWIESIVCFGLSTFLLILSLHIRLEQQNTPTASLQRVRPPANECPRYAILWWWGSSTAGALENAEYPVIAIAPRSTLARSGSTWKGPIYGSNRTKLCTYAKLNCLK